MIFFLINSNFGITEDIQAVASRNQPCEPELLKCSTNNKYQICQTNDRWSVLRSCPRSLYCQNNTGCLVKKIEKKDWTITFKVDNGKELVTVGVTSGATSSYDSNYDTLVDFPELDKAYMDIDRIYSKSIIGPTNKIYWKLNIGNLQDPPETLSWVLSVDVPKTMILGIANSQLCDGESTCTINLHEKSSILIYGPAEEFIIALAGE